MRLNGGRKAVNILIPNSAITVQLSPGKTTQDI